MRSPTASRPTSPSPSLLQGMTAHYLAHDSYPIEEGDRVLVHAAAGGVGQLLTQIAKLRGGRVIATASTDEKRALARDAGADEVLVVRGVRRAAREGAERAAAVVRRHRQDDVRSPASTRCAPTGRMILYGVCERRPEPVDPRMLESEGSLYVQRPTLGTYTRTPELLRARAAARLRARRARRLEGSDRRAVSAGGSAPRARGPRSAQDDREAAARAVASPACA